MASKKKLRRKIAALEQIIAEYEERDYARWRSYCEGYKQGHEAAKKATAKSYTKPKCDVTDEEYSELVNAAFNRSLGSDLR